MPINDNTTKVNRSGLSFTLESANKQKYPIIYSDDSWDIIKNESEMNNLFKNVGSFTQHEINDLLAKYLNIANNKIENVGSILNDIEHISDAEIDSLFF